MKIFLGIMVSTIIIASCTKIDTTNVGQGLIPSVDNVNTFAVDTFTIVTENGLFNDTSKVLKTDDHILGITQTNSNFGSTEASIYAQFNPAANFSWRASRDSILAVSNQGYDSAFLCLGLSIGSNELGVYGDSAQNITFEVYRINTTANFKSDSSYRLNADPNISNDNTLIGDITLKPKDLRNYNSYSLKGVRDSINNQLRIKLNAAGQAWVKTNWLHKDTSSGVNGGLGNVTSFTALNKGFYIKAKTGGNALLKVGLANNAKSRFEVWYRYKTAGIVDTAAQFFFFNPNFTDLYPSANANYIKRNVVGTAMNTSTAAGADALVYLESTPGSFTNIRIPSLKGFPKKLIHRAELLIQEDPSFYSNTFFSPTQIYLDAIDTLNVTPKRFLTIPFDLHVGASGLDFGYFGGSRNLRSDPIGGGTQSYYSFNLTKYIQNMTSQENTPNYQLRLYAPFDTRYYSQELGYYHNFGLGVNQNTAINFWPLINTPTFGRVVLGGGTGQYKMKLKIIYSNI